MSSEGPYSRYSAPTSNNPYGGSASGYGGYASSQDYNSSYGTGPVPGYGGGAAGGSYTMSMPQYNTPTSYGEDQVLCFESLYTRR
jgi:hypothetical protein